VARRCNNLSPPFKAPAPRPVRLRSQRPGAERTLSLGHPCDPEECDMARRDIEFDAEGITLRGWFYPAEGAGGTAPTIVMAHGFSAVKEMYLDRYAETFAAAGLNSLVYDNRNEVTLRSVEMLTEYEPITYLPYISPTPLLMLPARNDVLTPTDLAVAAYEKAREPKKLQFLPGGHFDAYVDGFDTSGPAARDWFVEHLTR
jgi:fermentation-respiration switch protein FrsA (DUF1100 family)